MKKWMTATCLCMILFTATICKAEDTVKESPTPVFGWLMHLWWDIPVQESISRITMDVDILKDVPQDLNFYIAPFGGSNFNKNHFYAGIQTHTGGFESKADHRMRPYTRGAIFSGWDIPGLDDIRLSQNGFCEQADYEGSFISTRKAYPWTKGKYTLDLRLIQKEVNPVTKASGCWVGYYIYSHEEQKETFIGALRFPGDRLIMERYFNSFLEFYGSPIALNMVPEFAMELSNFKINGHPACRSVSADYLLNQKNPAIIEAVPVKNGLRIQMSDKIITHNRTTFFDTSGWEYTPDRPVVAEEKQTLKMRIGDPLMEINHRQVEIDPGRGTVPVTVNDRTLIPAGKLIEAMGGTIRWSEKDQKVYIEYKNNYLELWINQNSALVNGRLVSMDVPPTLMNDRTYCPLRFVLESLNFSLSYDDGTQTIAITEN